jgi:hypothetical protein
MRKVEITVGIASKMRTVKRSFKDICFKYETIKAWDNDHNYHPIVKIIISGIKFSDQDYCELDHHNLDLYQNNNILKKIIKSVSSKSWSIYLIQNN